MTAPIRLVPPRHSGSREQAQRLVENLDHDLSAVPLVLECGGLEVTTPSFLDELVKETLVVRKARLLEIEDASARTGTLIQRAADNRQVADRLNVALRAA
jgi:hypothetical protein